MLTMFRETFRLLRHAAAMAPSAVCFGVICRVAIATAEMPSDFVNHLVLWIV